MLTPGLGRNKVKLFDTDEGFGEITNIRAVADPDVVKIGDQWWMFLGAPGDRSTEGQVPKVNLFSATLPPLEPLSSTKWSLTTSPDGKVAIPLVELPADGAWDSCGLHTPAYARGWDPTVNEGEGGWRERIYYCGQPTPDLSGPLAIGFLEWNGSRWVRQSDEPAFAPSEDWEENNVWEPLVNYHDGKWRLWYTARPAGMLSSDQTIGYAESSDGRTNWSKRKIVWPVADSVFDHEVLPANDRFEMVIARRCFTGPSYTPDAGLWWLSSDLPSGDREDWTEKPVRILDPGDGTPWHADSFWRPCVQYSDTDPNLMYVFFNGTYPSLKPPGTPWFEALAVGRMECVLEG